MIAPTVSVPLVSNTKDKISKHFCHYEVVRSSTASRLELDNDIYDQDTFENAKALALNVLDPIRVRFGSYGPNSWHRGEELEKAICWANKDKSSFGRWCKKYGMLIEEDSWPTYFKKKQHPKGAAADIEIAGLSNDDLYEWIRDNLEYDQLIREFPKVGQPMSGWVHVSWNRHGANRMMAFTIG